MPPDPLARPPAAPLGTPLADPPINPPVDLADPPLPGPAPRVSVVLPAFNRAALVARAVDSVLAQTFRDFELIVVDDASTDATRAVLERYRGAPRVRLVLLGRNRGGGGARNLGVRAARGALIAFQDSDDAWLPGKLAAQVAALDAHPEAGLCYCAALFSDGAVARRIPPAGFARLDGDMSREVLKTNTTSTQVMLVRREALARAAALGARDGPGEDAGEDGTGEDGTGEDGTGEDAAGPFDPTLRRFQDWDLVIRLAQVTPFVFLPEPGAVIFATPGNISSGLAQGAAARSAILAKYRPLFEAAPRRAARQHWAAAKAWHNLGRRAEAAHHAAQAAKLQLKAWQTRTDE